MLALNRFAERAVCRTFADAGVIIGGDDPWDIRVHDPVFFLRLAVNPGLQLGETYMAGMWDCDQLDEMVYRLLRGGVGAHQDRDPMFVVRNTWARVVNRQSRPRAPRVAEAHYDLDTELYRSMRDDTMTYTCGYWTRPSDTLADAQRNKLRMVCDKLDLRPGETLLDIGCGFGGLAAFAAEHYGARVLGVTNSMQHHKVARERCAKLPVELALMDYRDLPSLRRRFDKISSIEMIEAVGPKNFATFMDVAHGCLAEGGRFLVQSFISPSSRYVCNEWFDRYIFPNGVSPSFAQLSRATESNFGAPKDVHDLGAHYAPTLLAWDANVRRHWPQLARRYDERFRRMWRFYLRTMAGTFRAEDLRLCQIVYGKGAIGEVRAHSYAAPRELMARAAS